MVRTAEGYVANVAKDKVAEGGVVVVFSGVVNGCRAKVDAAAVVAKARQAVRVQAWPTAQVEDSSGLVLKEAVVDEGDLLVYPLGAATGKVVVLGEVFA